MMRFLAIGECMAELSPIGPEGDYRLGFAGDTFNTAWYLARLCPETQVAFFSAVGVDAISAQMRQKMVNDGIDDQFLQANDHATIGLYLISLTNGERSFSYWRGQSAARQMLRDPALLQQAVEGSDLIYFSGITLAILDDAQRHSLFSILSQARADGKTVAFDPNLRPRLWDDSQHMTKVITQGASVSDVVLPSFEDEASWFDDATPQATAKRYVQAGATTVVVKNGAEPVYFISNGRTGQVPVTPAPVVVDTTAAGDSFNAEILAGLIDGTSISDSIARACRLAGHVVQGKGALVPIDLDLIAR